jgi:hypothetical protein
VLSPYSHSDEGLLSGRRGGGDASRMWTSAVAACSTSSIVVSYAPVSWQRGSWGRGAPTLASVADGGGAGNKGSGPIGGWRKVSHICTAYGKILASPKDLERFRGIVGAIFFSFCAKENIRTRISNLLELL